MYEPREAGLLVLFVDATRPCLRVVLLVVCGSSLLGGGTK